MSLPLQIMTSASNGKRRIISARSFARLTVLRITKVPAAPTLTTSKRSNSSAKTLGRNVLCPPTLTPLRRTTSAIDSSLLSGGSPGDRGLPPVVFTAERRREGLKARAGGANSGLAGDHLA